MGFSPDGFGLALTVLQTLLLFWVRSLLSEDEAEWVRRSRARRSIHLPSPLTPRFSVGHEKWRQRMGFSPDVFGLVLTVLQTLFLFYVRSPPSEDYAQRVL